MQETQPSSEDTQEVLPSVGDLVTSESGFDYIVSDIKGESTDTPVWQMRPSTGGSRLTPVDRSSILSWTLKARRGTYRPPM